MPKIKVVENPNYNVDIPESTKENLQSAVQSFKENGFTDEEILIITGEEGRRFL